MLNKLNLVDKNLKKFIEESILPEYNKNEKAHGIDHINYVIRRSFELIEQNKLSINNIDSLLQKYEEE